MAYQSRLPRAAAELRPSVDAAVAKAAALIAGRAKERVPVDTGRLRNAIHVERVDDAAYKVVAGDDDAFYGHIVEHGGVHHSPHPFLTPAFEDSRNEALDLINAALNRL